MSKDVTRRPGDPPSVKTHWDVEKTRTTQPDPNSVRIFFGFDATGSRAPTWRAGMDMQADILNMFSKAGEQLPLIRVSYFRGEDEYKATNWTNNTHALIRSMRGITCITGNTQISRMLGDAARQAKQGKISAVLYVGDQAEENMAVLNSAAGNLGDIKLPVYIFQEGNDQTASYAFQSIARLSGGRCFKFDEGLLREMRDAVKVVFAQASGNKKVIETVRNDRSLTGEAKRISLTFQRNP